MKNTTLLWFVLRFSTVVLKCRNKICNYEIGGEVKKMGEKKKAYCVTVVLLVFSVFCPMVFAGAAQTNKSPPTLDSWQPPKDFVNPVTLKIQEFRAQGLNDEQITAELEKLGMGWYPETGATWVGRMLTPEELAEMPDRTPAKATSNEKSTRGLTGKTSCMRTSSSSWTGVASEIVSGSMSVSSGNTIYHYVTMQLGNLDAGTNWVETVLTHNYGETYKWYTYDNDEGGWSYYMNKNTAITTADTYTIMLDGTQDGDGWNYNVWINNQWVRSGHLSNLWVQAGFQKEVYSNSGQFTNDASHTVYYKNWLHNAGGWPYWTSTVNTWWSTDNPVQETHSMGASSYHWETWVQN